MTAPRLTNDEWAHVNRAFHRVLDADPADRSHVIEESCRSHPGLCQELRSLLAAHERADDFISRPAAAMVSTHNLVGRNLGHYRIVGVLGVGGMGVVYRAEDTRLGRHVALKAVSPRWLHDQSRLDGLEREARTAAQLNHPGIATVYALERIDDQVLVASELVEGETLRDELRRGPLTAAALLDTAAAITRALHAAHTRGIVHRDLKPENVMRTPAGTVKILDFGLATLHDDIAADSATGSQATHAGLVGTPAYMSPEQIRGDAVDARSDIFALGVLIHELCSGHPPFAGTDASTIIAGILSQPAPDLARAARGPDWTPAMRSAVVHIVARCLEKRPADRFQTASDLNTALDAARGHAVSAAATSGTARWWWTFHQGAVSVAYAGLIVGLWYTRTWSTDVSGRYLLVAGLVGGVAAVALRLHLWFVARSHPPDWTSQGAHVAPWLRLADTLFSLTIGVAGLWLLSVSETAGAILLASAVVVLISFAIIEPATARAAQREFTAN